MKDNKKYRLSGSGNESLPAPKGANKPKAGNSSSKSDREKVMLQLTPYFLIVFSLFLFLCLVTEDMFDSKGALGVVGSAMRNLMCGLFGVTAYAIPFLFTYLGIRWRTFLINGNLSSKVVVTFVTLVDLSALIHVFKINSNGQPYGVFKLGTLYLEGKALRGGGIIGGFFGECSYLLLNVIGSVVVGLALLVVFLIFLSGLSPVEVWGKICAYVRFVKARANERKERAVLEAEENEAKKAEKQEREREEIEKRLKEEEERRREREEKRREKEEEKREKEEAKRAKEAMLAEQQVISDLEDNSGFDTGFSREETRKTWEAHKEARRKLEQEGAENAKTDEEDGEKKGFFAKIEKRLSGDDNSISSSDDEESLDMLFIDPVDKDDSKPEEKLEVRKVALKKIESDECTADGVCLGDAEEEEESREERQERMSKLDARGNELIEYTFPPHNLLKVESETAEADAEAELRSNADILMKTFDNFKVGIKEISYSRGPTITRYELLPDSGTRIRTIANLVDDIGLALATSGIRMEAPIPNKSLVGIEVPNKVRSNVYARQLIDSDTFKKAESRLWTCLGKDVAGSPVFFDISKMPHLLIAGATGMGKSVCINTIIVSLLYKARPDEVKLMLIDPKKVEFGVYNGIPHLLVPVVTDPKKSAGTLQWAVNEMERRFELIESVNMRDIKSYNAITAGDPEKEFMPHIVIIIDELADLMMTAADDVETSICRLAQKARAAGIHLIIGTQRPSVDVITGLIKSNIPSRIAFTVASQIDSRTILDTAGAEKLIGKGDMLFNPVGAMKPIRVQGAFISEDEVINITNFIKANSSAVKYDDGVISSIEEAAAMCGQKKGSKEAAAAADALIGDSDPLFRKALEIAVDNGSVATSMLQRNINVGYGRAARIIDRMEKLRFVSPPRGNKHREVLITRAQFDQMVVDGDPRVDGLTE